MPLDEMEQYDAPKTTVQCDDGCALAKPTTRVRKSTPTSRGADPKRPATRANHERERKVRMFASEKRVARTEASRRYDPVSEVPVNLVASVTGYLLKKRPKEMPEAAL